MNDQKSIDSVIIHVRGLSAFYGKHEVLKNINLKIAEKKITAIIGPSGCGKTTLIRCFNRLFEMAPDASLRGGIYYKDSDIMSCDSIDLRREIGMVFQRPNPFPTMHIYNNVIAGFRLNGRRLKKSDADRIVEETLKKVALWDEVKDKLFQSPQKLSSGQQQRLCIARTIAVSPQVILLDEPCAALDPISTSKIEELILALKKDYTIIIVTHNMQQAARVSDYTAFLMLGDLVEFGPTNQIFTSPKNKRTEEYITGRFG
jgi:phosphate transport system ATP-binding protein